MEIEKELEKLTIRKKAISIVFIGHVDAGKSTTGGQVLYLAGKVDKRTLEKYEKDPKDKSKEATHFSWALDSNPEEREKGRTTELGHASFEIEQRSMQILDAPGHRMYVPNMILGVNQADVAVLVISAKQNEFEAGFEKGGQTKEHVYLAKASGISKVCVLINKMDDASVHWSEERYGQIIATTKKMLHALFGKESVTYIPISGAQGDNIKNRVGSEQCAWYAGPTFFEYLNGLEIEREKDAMLYATVTDTVKETANAFALLRVERGVLEKAQYKLMPGSRKITVVAVFKEEEEAESAESGDIVRARIKEPDEIFPGDVICAQEYAETVDSNCFLAQISLLDAKSLISKGYAAIMHMGARTIPVTIGEMYRKEEGKIKKLVFAKAGDKFVAEIQTKEEIPLEICLANRRSGIFTIRDETRTVGFGKVQKIKEKK